MPHSQKLFSYELRCSFTYSNHLYGLEIDIKVHTRPFLAHNKTKCVTRFFEKSVRDIILESGSEVPNLGSRINLKKSLPLYLNQGPICVHFNYVCVFSFKLYRSLQPKNFPSPNDESYFMFRHTRGVQILNFITFALIFMDLLI